MASKKLETVFFESWNTYASSMMSVLEDCGMWKKEDTLQEFFGVTGIGFQFRMHKRCEAIGVTDYDWICKHTEFMKRIGVETQIIFAAPNDVDYSAKQKIAIEEIKTSIDNEKAVTVWGIDTGEFGIINGYDDEDGVFFTKGIGSKNSDESNPILYKNLGKTFQYAPILFCQIPISCEQIDKKNLYINSFRTYCDEMQSINNSNYISCGLAAYDAWIKAISTDYDVFGLRYCVGVYFERKEALLSYALLVQKHFANNNEMGKIVEVFKEIVYLYNILRNDILDQGSCGWNDLWLPVNKEDNKKMIEIIAQIKENEVKALQYAKEFVGAFNVNL